MLPVAVAWPFTDDSAIRYVIPDPRTASCYHIMEPMGQNQRPQCVLSSSPGGGTGGEVCRLRWRLVIVLKCNTSCLCKRELLICR